MSAPVFAAAAVLTVLATSVPLAAGVRVLHAELELPAPASEVFRAWTTREGIVAFFAPDGQVDLRVDGTYDVWFNPSGAPGERGAEGMRILDVDPPRRFAFTWNAPPSIPAIRGKRTVVVVELNPKGPTATELRFTQLGWGEGADWDKAYDYFDRAWGAIVLPRLKYRFEKGPVVWTAPPELSPIAPTLKLTLVTEPR